MIKSFVITLKDNAYSKLSAKRCIESAKKFGIAVEPFYGIDKNNAMTTMKEHNLKWTWAKNNTETTYCPITHLRQHPYSALDLKPVIGCFMSHFLLWKKCIELKESILILEHDSVFLRPLPDIEFEGICQINDPAGATRRGSWWSKKIKQRGIEGVYPKTWVTSEEERYVPDGLAGNSAYLIKPWAAQELISKVYEIGVWPNDAIMCQQLFPYLEEYYPFITKVVQTKSTTTGKGNG